MSEVHAAAPAVRVPAAPAAAVLWVGLVIAGAAVGEHHYAQDPLIRIGSPPLVGTADLRVSLRLAPALALALVAWRLAPGVARRLGWRALLAATWVAAAAWAVLLAAGDGLDAITAPLLTRYEYLRAVPLVDSPGTFLAGYVDALPGYPTHVKGHPPGTVLAFWALERLGLGGATAAAAVVIAAGAAAAPAALVTLRSLAGEAAARAAAPFLAFAPAAVWLATSADALFAGMIAAAIALFAVATGGARRAGALALASGAAFGLALELTYGAVLLAALLAAITLHRRAWREAALAAAGAVAVLALFATAGFWWLDGLAATRELYESGVAARRPYLEFILIDVAAFALAAGPAAAAAAARLPPGPVAVLAGAAGFGLAAAALSGLSRGEVERIWLPFVPWVLVATCALRGARGWLAAQLALGVALQAGVRSPW